MATVRMRTPQGNYFMVREEEVGDWEDRGYEKAPVETEEQPRKARRSRARKEAAEEPTEE